MSLTPTSTSPHLVPGLHAEPNPAVVHVRRPASAASETVQIDSIRTVSADELDLPPVVLRLPNLASITKGLPQVSISSLAHWVFLALGGLLALWLIFGGRAKPLPAVDDAPAFTQPARAEASSTPSWNPPPLESAGDSIAPGWTPPAAAPAATTAPTFQMSTPAPPVAPAAAPTAEQPAAEQPGGQTPTGQAPAAAPAQSESFSGGESSVAQSASPYEAWPASGQPPATGSTASAPAAGPGPVLRTAQREPAPAATATSAPAASTQVPTASTEAPTPTEAYPAGDVEPLGITVPVPQ